VWVDTETTSLRPDRRAWDIAVIVRDDDGDHEHQWYVDAHDLDLGNADPYTLSRFGFYQRHPQGTRSAGPYTLPPGELDVLLEVEELTRGAVLAGSNPGFDTDVLGARMRANRICPSWHYHPLDVPTLAHGWLLGSGLPGLSSRPTSSDAVSAACGVDPAGYDRHTALGDCRWMRDLHDMVVTGEAR
jgi:hypothetical protein